MAQTLLIENGTILTMDADRRILEGGYVLVEDGRIAAIGTGVPDVPPQAERIDATGMVVMPGLIDTHAHAGHMLTKGLGSDSDEWMTITGRIYAEATDPEFWAAEAALSAAERIRCGTTTAALLFGGGPDIMRTETADAAQAHLAAIADMGVREVLAVGPNRPSANSVYREHDGGSYREIAVSPQEQLAVSAALIDTFAGRDDRLRLAVSLPVFTAAELEDDAVSALCRAARALAREKGVLLV